MCPRPGRSLCWTGQEGSAAMACSAVFGGSCLTSFQGRQHVLGECPASRIVRMSGAWGTGAELHNALRHVVGMPPRSTIRSASSTASAGLWVTSRAVFFSVSRRVARSARSSEAVIERPEGLIEEQHVRIDQQRACQGRPLGHAQRQLAWIIVFVPSQPDPGQPLWNAAWGSGALTSCRLRSRVSPGQKARLLEDVGEGCPGLQYHPPTAGRQQARCDVEASISPLPLRPRSATTSPS